MWQYSSCTDLNTSTSSFFPQSAPNCIPVTTFPQPHDQTEEDACDFSMDFWRSWHGEAARGQKWGVCAMTTAKRIWGREKTTEEIWTTLVDEPCGWLVDWFGFSVAPSRYSLRCYTLLLLLCSYCALCIRSSGFNRRTWSGLGEMGVPTFLPVWARQAKTEYFSQV